MVKKNGKHTTVIVLLQFLNVLKYTHVHADCIYEAAEEPNSADYLHTYLCLVSLFRKIIPVIRRIETFFFFFSPKRCVTPWRSPATFYLQTAIQLN